MSLVNQDSFLDDEDCDDLPALVESDGSLTNFDEGREEVSWRSIRGVDVIPRLVDYSDSEGSEEEEEEEDEDSQFGGGRESPLSGSWNSVPLPIRDYYELSPAWNVYIKKFRLHGRAYHVQLRNIDRMADLEAVMIDLIRNTLDEVFSTGDPTDLIGVTFKHPGLRRGEYHVPFQQRQLLTPERIFQILEVLIGYDGVDVDSNFEIVFTRVAQTRGGRGREKSWKRAQFVAKHSHAFINIDNLNDNLCLPRALVTAKARLELRPKIEAGDGKAKSRWERIRKGDRHRDTLQKRLAQELARDAGLGDHTGPYGEDEILKLQAVLEPEYQIKIFSSRISNCLTFQGEIPPENEKNVLHIYHYYVEGESAGHFIVCTKPHVLFTKQYWCDTCNGHFNDKRTHRCISKCNCCFKLNLCPLTEWKHCSDCNRNFRSEQCFQNHITVAQPVESKKKKGENNENPRKKKRVNLSICEICKICEKCGVLVNYVKARKRVLAGKIEALHKCGYIFCRNCQKNHKEGEHACFIQPIRDKKMKNSGEDISGHGAGMEQKENGVVEVPNIEIVGEELDEENDPRVSERAAQVDEVMGLLGGDGEVEEENLNADQWGTKIFFDFESAQVKIIGQNNLGPILEHVPNYCVARKVCILCQENENIGECVNCKEGQWVFEGDNCRDDFCSWLFDEPNYGATAIAHNSKRYDSQFLIQFLIQECTVPQVVMKGTEFMLVKCRGIRIIDSLNFFPMGLAELPKAFNLTEMKKGYFPHKFNTPENETYVGKIPDAWYFDPGNMKEEKRAEFYKWHDDQKAANIVYDFRKEMAEYCKSDVDILMKSCLQFEKDCVDLVDMRPFDDNITIASFCMRLFRKLFLKPDSIGIVPPFGYRGKENQSLIALRWLKWLSEQNDIHISHAGNGYEKRIGPYKVDGFHSTTNTVYEFNGCVWHGHTCRLDRTKKVPNSRKTMDDAYQDWITRKTYLQSEGYTVVEKWECELRRELGQDREMRDFFDSVEFREPLDVSQALKGGRTNAIRLHHKCKRGERMDYVDVVSLYPWGVKYTKFPRGHPTVITENFQTIAASRNPYFGIIKCKVLPPRKLFHPVLPHKSGGKLMFPLCRVCAETQRQDFCDHEDSDREFIGDFVSTELDKALQVGYEIKKIYEVWHYLRQSSTMGQMRTLDFSQSKYINFFLKLKIEASGWPKWVKTEEQKKEFLAECEKREGIQLDPSKIEKNPGKRQVAKLCLNSFWGKFGQRSNMTEDEFVKDPKKFSNIMFNQKNVVENVRVINEEILLVSYRKEEEYSEAMPYSNKVIAAFTTANCRLRLYEELEKLGDRVCYFDTDSIIYVTRPGDIYHPKKGSFLGDMTDELEDYGPGAFIEEFVSGGPKNYGYRVKKLDGKRVTKVKIRGFTLNFHAAEKLNFDNLKKKVFDFVRGVEGNPTIIVQPMIARTSERQVVTKDVAKKYGIVYDKRWILPDFSTLPYGTFLSLYESVVLHNVWQDKKGKLTREWLVEELFLNSCIPYVRSEIRKQLWKVCYGCDRGSLNQLAHDCLYNYEAVVSAILSDTTLYLEHKRDKIVQRMYDLLKEDQEKGQFSYGQYVYALDILEFFGPEEPFKKIILDRELQNRLKTKVIRDSENMKLSVVKFPMIEECLDRLFK